MDVLGSVDAFLGQELPKDDELLTRVDRLKSRRFDDLPVRRHVVVNRFGQPLGTYFETVLCENGREVIVGIRVNSGGTLKHAHLDDWKLEVRGRLVGESLIEVAEFQAGRRFNIVTRKGTLSGLCNDCPLLSQYLIEWCLLENTHSSICRAFGTGSYSVATYEMNPKLAGIE